MLDIYEELENYVHRDMVPLHMPGHKRNTDEFVMDNPYLLDITEIDGFDNLHNPQGILLESMKEAADLYGSDRTFYLVNGSSVGILAAISSAVPRGGKIMVARNCHRSVYNGIYINELFPVYLYPEIDEKLGISKGLTEAHVEKELESNQNIGAIVITSPTYEGMISDIRKIAEQAHRYNIPLIVDEAHGAHFGFHKEFPRSALAEGADIVIQSIHKTLPAFTQTALLHIREGYADIGKIERYLDIYQSTSPSYLLMAGIDRCMKFLRTEGKKKFEHYVRNLKNLRENIKKLSYIQMVETDDISKIVLHVKQDRLNGRQFYDILLKEYHIQLEMASIHYVIAMTSVGDKEEYYQRFWEALQKIDRGLGGRKPSCVLSENSGTMKGIKAEVITNSYIAMNGELEQILLLEAEGRISGSSVCIYPPGSPLVAPGERITDNSIKILAEACALGLEIIGLEKSGTDIGKAKISVMKFGC